MDDRLTPDEWCEMLGVTILDPDGWNRRDFERSWAERLTYRQFRENALISTTSGAHDLPREL